MEADVKLATLTSLLDLDEFEVVEASRDRRNKLRRFTLVPKVIAGLCPHCSGLSDERHQCHDRVIADLPMGGCQTELVVRLWQFYCRSCDKFFTPRLATLADGAHATERLLESLSDLASRSDLTTAARFFGPRGKDGRRLVLRLLGAETENSGARPSAGAVAGDRRTVNELSLKKDTGNSAVC